MFERFTPDARRVVAEATRHAALRSADTVTEEHLLLALLDQRGTGAADLLAVLGVTARRASVERGLGEAHRRAGLTRADAEALAGLGIDVAEIVGRVEAAHGEGVLQGDVTSKRWRSGHRAFSREAKSVLERSLRIALAHKDRTIPDVYILLALTARPGVAAEVLADHGATHGALQQALAERRAAAGAA
ncbi:Clp protease N-terminal domain-containing protein [Streptomyces sp. NBC_01497]|uniref:Clp protease N-terminal domain-containing protein n=1 Tax=Streptomyces sp. NBC_01497 TaxID=2903885 RepID=UPI002E32A5AD|nr:Clp protease N-terminal domain-containing protein [Streptomyces sp. NBC_01497]